jgi:anhydro-N-acetylmuramic acid kinase
MPTKPPTSYHSNNVIKVVGLMSGTSMDSISTALFEISGDFSRLERGFKSILNEDIYYSNEAVSLLKKLPNLTIREVAELHQLIGEEFAHAALTVLSKAKVDPKEIYCIGSHGQTVYHYSGVEGAKKCTLQLGCGDVIAERTGITTVSDFRTRDVAAGGEGAPLTPYGDFVLFRSPNKKRIILNLGGISNITILGDTESEVFGFDTGPANSLIDRAAARVSKGSQGMDINGQRARSGDVVLGALTHMLAHPYFKKSPPKSSGYELFGEAFLDEVLKNYPMKDNDFLATITELTAVTISDAIRNFVPGIDLAETEVVAAGGGVKNSYLMERISFFLSPATVTTSALLGMPYNAREAVIFGLMGCDMLLGRCTSLPRVTGAKDARRLGKVSYAQ